ncbi:MAG: hypothetical protein ACKVY0_14460 [Prosthecobacter sp.]|uniref:hypothetical protein n=1 Tax=Prosthecobacter sp. TaxID=1965333 RepID=UPI003900E415
MKFLSRPAFYIIALLIVAMLLLTLWMQWILSQPLFPIDHPPKEKAPAAVSTRP